jgi:hypothetical protein
MRNRKVDHLIRIRLARVHSVFGDAGQWQWQIDFWQSFFLSSCSKINPGWISLYFSIAVFIDTNASKLAY